MSSPERDGPVTVRDVVAAGLCVGCGACAARGGGMGWDAYGQLKPSPETRRSDVAQLCPFSPRARDETELARDLFPSAATVDPVIGRFEAAYVGHAAEPGFREQGSSGGMVSWVAAELLRQGLVDGVAHVVAADPEKDGRFFRYAVSRGEAELRAGAKSRYYPVELSEVLREIRETPGRYAVVGIPCFIKAVHLQRRADPVLRDRIAFTLGLYCGHMKSARFVESFAWQLGTRIEQVAQVDYRLKNPGRPANWYTACLTLGDGSTRMQDWWHFADGDWGAGFFQNSACDFCDDVIAETADISFGDAWVEPYSSDGRGTNVVVVRAPRIQALLEAGIADGRLDLRPVDARFVESTQEAGFRHRREGLAYRLARRRSDLVPRKRVAPGAEGLRLRRRLVYRMRRHIAAWSHRIFLAARIAGLPAFYTGWARTALALYQALTYSRGRLGATFDRIEAEWTRRSASLPKSEPLRGGGD